MTDARFEDAAFSDQPLRLRIEDADDLPVASALLQDAVGRAGDVSWMPRRRRLVLLLNRFRWEDRDTAVQGRRAFERVRSALVLDSVNHVQARGISPKDRDAVFSLLALVFEPGDAPGGSLILTGAGAVEMVLSVECLEGQLIDLTRPWEAATAPVHAPD